MAQLIKVKDSYNCDKLSQVAGVAALRDQGYLAETRAKIVARAGGDGRASTWATPSPRVSRISCGRREVLRLRTPFSGSRTRRSGEIDELPGYPKGLRISVGTDAEIDQLLKKLGEIV